MKQSRNVKDHSDHTQPTHPSYGLCTYSLELSMYSKGVEAKAGSTKKSPLLSSQVSTTAVVSCASIYRKLVLCFFLSGLYSMQVRLPRNFLMSEQHHCSCQGTGTSVPTSSRLDSHASILAGILAITKKSVMHPCESFTSR